MSRGAARWQKAGRHGGTIGREEFAAIIDGGLDAARLACERVRNRLATLNLPVAVAQGRKACPFAGSDRGGERRVEVSVIGTAKLNDVDPQAWLADVPWEFAFWLVSSNSWLGGWESREHLADAAAHDQ